MTTKQKKIREAIAPAAQAIATRMNNADNRFIELCVEQFGFTAEEAVKILNVYIKLKVVKMNIVQGCYDWSHGAFVDRVPMENALKMYKAK